MIDKNNSWANTINCYLVTRYTYIIWQVDCSTIFIIMIWQIIWYKTVFIAKTLLTH